MKAKSRKGPTPFEVLTFDARLSPEQARKALESFKRRKFVVLSARDQIGMQKSINEKIKVIIDLMMFGQETERRRTKLAGLLLTKMESEREETDSQNPRHRRNLTQYLLGPMPSRKQGRKARARLRANRK